MHWNKLCRHQSVLSQTARLKYHEARAAGVHVVHVGGKPRIEHDRMILNHRHDHVQPWPDLSLAIAKDEVIGRPRYPESIKTGGKHKNLRYEKWTPQYEIYFSRQIPNQNLWTYPSRRVGRRCYILQYFPH